MVARVFRTRGSSSTALGKGRGERGPEPALEKARLSLAIGHRRELEPQHRSRRDLDDAPEHHRRDSGLARVVVRSEAARPLARRIREYARAFTGTGSTPRSDERAPSRSRFWR